MAQFTRWPLSTPPCPSCLLADDCVRGDRGFTPSPRAGHGPAASCLEGASSAAPLSTLRAPAGLACAAALVSRVVVPPMASAPPGLELAATACGPLIIAHRGASGYRPEHTLAAYELAVELGADYIEPDLVMTLDGVLVDRHGLDISATTDVTGRVEFAGRRRKQWIDGVLTSGWFVGDFTLAELKTLRVKERLGDIRPGSAQYDGRFEVPTFEEILELRADLSRSTGRAIGIIPEIKHSTHLHEQGFDPEAEVTRLARKFRLNARRAPLWVQSFELTSLKDLRRRGLRARTTFLTSVEGGPWDLREQGTTYAELTTPDALSALSRWIDGLAPEKAQVIPLRADGSLGEPTSLVADAHAAGLEVTPWTFRAENAFLPADYRAGAEPADLGRASEEVLAFLRAGVDGVFCDQPDIGLEARSRFVAASQWHLPTP